MSIKEEMKGEIDSCLFHAKKAKFDICLKAIGEAKQLIDSLPDNMPTRPRILIGRDGEINFMWKGADEWISISIRPDRNKRTTMLGGYNVIVQATDHSYSESVRDAIIGQPFPAKAVEWLMRQDPNKPFKTHTYETN